MKQAGMGGRRHRRKPSEGLQGARPPSWQDLPSLVPPTVLHWASERQQEPENWKLGSCLESFGNVYGLCCYPPTRQSHREKMERKALCPCGASENIGGEK